MIPASFSSCISRHGGSLADTRRGQAFRVPRSAFRVPPAARGMTLIEMIVVMLIIAIIMSVSIPAFTSLGRGSGMRAAVAGVRNTLALSRQWAITHKEEVTFCWDRNTASGGTFYVRNQAGTNICNVVTNSLDVNFQNNGSLTFKPDGGLASGALPKSIVIEDSRPGVVVTKTITIYGLTGGIKVE